MTPDPGSTAPDPGSAAPDPGSTAPDPGARRAEVLPPAAVHEPGGTSAGPDRRGPALPRLVAEAGEEAAKRFIEYFTVQIANPRTRRAYASAVVQFMDWCEGRDLTLQGIEPIHAAYYIRSSLLAKPTIRLHLAAIRMLFNWLVIHQVIRTNPAAAVKGPRQSSTRGTTPVLTRKQVRLLLDSIDVDTLAGGRDAAFISMMLYSFARVSAVAGLRVMDYYLRDEDRWLRLYEKGGKRHDVPVHPKAAEAVDRYIRKGGVEGPLEPIFQSMNPAATGLTGKAWSARAALHMVKRRAKAAGLPPGTCCHSFRATGITLYLGNGGTIEHAQLIAGHRSPLTTKLYDRNQDAVTVEEIRKIVV